VLMGNPFVVRAKESSKELLIDTTRSDLLQWLCK
jgi:hypothetical protein